MRLTADDLSQIEFFRNNSWERSELLHPSRLVLCGFCAPPSDSPKDPDWSLERVGSIKIGDKMLLANGLGEAGRRFIDLNVPDSEIVNFTPAKWLGKRWSSAGPGGLGKGPLTLILIWEGERHRRERFSELLDTVRGCLL